MYRCLRLLLIPASVLLIGDPVTAGSLSYEALDGTRCQVSTDRPASLDLRIDTNHNDTTGYFSGSDSGFNASVGLTVPLSQPTRTARQHCEQMGQLDQQRNHFMWLQELYEQGVIKRSALVKAGKALGLELAEGATISHEPSFELTIP